MAKKEAFFSELNRKLFEDMKKACIILSIIAAAAYIASVVINAHGTEFKYNLTDRMNQETRLLDLCINAPDIKIPNCNMIYGGVNTTYGDQIK